MLYVIYQRAITHTKEKEKVMRMSKAKVAYMKRNAEAFTVVASLHTHSGRAPETNTLMEIDNVINVLESVPFFKRLGGTERTNTKYETNGDFSIITIDHFSRAPHNGEWSNRLFTITCKSDAIYMLANA